MVPFDIEALAPLPSGHKPLAAYTLVTTDYFRTMDIALRQGRTFTQQDDQNAVHVVIISESTARLYWPNENPVGKNLILTRNNRPPFKAEIVGIVADVRQTNLVGDLGRQ